MSTEFDDFGGRRSSYESIPMRGGPCAGLTFGEIDRPAKFTMCGSDLRFPDGTYAFVRGDDRHFIWTPQLSPLDEAWAEAESMASLKCDEALNIPLAWCAVFAAGSTLFIGTVLYRVQWTNHTSGNVGLEKA